MLCSPSCSPNSIFVRLCAANVADVLWPMYLAIKEPRAGDPCFGLAHSYVMRCGAVRSIMVKTNEGRNIYYTSTMETTEYDARRAFVKEQCSGIRDVVCGYQLKSVVSTRQRLKPPLRSIYGANDPLWTLRFPELIPPPKNFSMRARAVEEVLPGLPL